MSQLRAPATRPDRREGGRHGRSGARALSSAGRPQSTPPNSEARIRPQLMRTAVLPAVVVSLSGAAAVLFTIRSTEARPSAALWLALAGSAVLAVVAVVAAALGAERTARSVLDRAQTLRRSSARRQAELTAVVDGLRRGERPPARESLPAQAAAGDELDLLAQELTRSHDAAVTAVVQASRLSSSVGNEQKVEVFVNLARRLQSLVHREIQLLDELENEVEDPELLKGLFHVDHLATRIRRHAENLAVLGGAISRRQWSNPVTMTEVLRSSIAEVEQYPRVKLVPPIDGTLRGHAVADVIHLLAELVENATLFSAPHTQVLLRASHVTAGLAVEVEDRGLGMPLSEQNKMNALLADPDQVNVAHLLQDGRIGLFVVSALARRHGIAVRLQSNIYGGIQAVLVLPQGLLGAEPGAGGSADQQGAHRHADRPPAATAAVAGGVAGREQAAAPGGAAPYPAVDAAHTADAHHTGSQRTLTYATSMPGMPHQQSAADSAAPGPLPVRGEHPERPNPAGPRPAAGHMAAPPAPVQPPPRPPAPRHAPSSSESPAVRGTMGRPQLPKRRAQEHLAPQLRDEPAPRRPQEEALHDPGLMAAFQRGIGLAEAGTPGAGDTVTHEPQQQHDTHKE
ncbi:sensor histidine kinase [Streptomyces wuyuanensis]|uniref:histidine kinase n=1 Tax=Streptomyces wuyuanensis TaxID=1196353 RepID=A0A1H0CC99_9ACTN|nr:ATP-binding protein [Streptomyces wuyuanensis]SDN55466.1 Signal transduction histidine kinase [Streptomyces wuyuanensis]